MMDIEKLKREMAARSRALEVGTSLANQFFETRTYKAFRSRMFDVIEQRNLQLLQGQKELIGAALIGAAGSGKSRMAAQAIGEYEAFAEATGGRDFGFKIVSAIVPGRSTVKETLRAILEKLGYRAAPSRDDDYLAHTVMTLIKRHRVAAIHLDEVQDAGRYKTSDNMSLFSKRFRNFMQHDEWPVCLILSGTLESRSLINHDTTLTRRLHPIEIMPMSFEEDAAALRSAAEKLLGSAMIGDGGLFAEDEFMKILIHAAAYRFGVAIEMIIGAIVEAVWANEAQLSLDGFAGVYFTRTHCDDDLNPFVAKHWRGSIQPKHLGASIQSPSPKRRKNGRRNFVLGPLCKRPPSGRPFSLYDCLSPAAQVSFPVTKVCF